MTSAVVVLEKWMEGRVVAAGGKRNIKVRWKGEKGSGSPAPSNNPSRWVLFQPGSL